MSLSFVFLRSLVLAVVVGGFLLFTGKPARRPQAILAFALTALLVHASWWWLPALDGTAAHTARWLVSAWVGALLSATVLIVPTALLLAVRWLIGRRPAGAPAISITFMTIPVLIGVASAFGTMEGPVIREEVVEIDGLPRALDGLRIANLGDVHIGPFIRPQDLAHGIDLINARHVDLLAVTGDLIDDLDQLEPTLDALARSNAQPVVSVLGNHDKHPDQAAVVAALRRRHPRIQLLINESVLLHPRGSALRLVGVDYALSADGQHMLPRREQDAAMRRFAERAFARAAPGDTILALSHHPEFFPIAAARGAALTLSSHTHGGQISLFGRPLIVAYDYMHGIYRQDGAVLDVSAGFGHWLPLRVGVPREISIITLKAH